MQILASETIKTNSIFYFYFFFVVGEGEKGRERGRIKNNKKRVFKWNDKKKKFNIKSIIKWCITCYEIKFLKDKC